MRRGTSTAKRATGLGKGLGRIRDTGIRSKKFTQGGARKGKPTGCILGRIWRDCYTCEEALGKERGKGKKRKATQHYRKQDARQETYYGPFYATRFSKN